MGRGRREHAFSKMSGMQFHGRFTGLLRAFNKQIHTVSTLTVNHQLQDMEPPYPTLI